MRLIFDDRSFSKDEILTPSFKEREYQHLTKFQQETVDVLARWLDSSSFMTFKTSGSTGVPKIIRHSKTSMMASADKTIAYFGLSQGQCALLCLPVNFIAGTMMMVRAVRAELDLICVTPSSHPIEKLIHRIDFAAMTPYQVACELETVPKKLGSIRKLLLGGAPVSAKLERSLSDLPAECYVGYGMTETITHIAVRRLSGSDDKSFTALEGVTFKTDHLSRLIVNADHLDAREVRTTDVVTLISPRRFIWRGRTDHVINSGGLKLHPEQIEHKLDSLLDYRFFIAPLPDEKLGQKVVLFVEGHMTDVALTKFRANCALVLEKYEVPKNIYFVPRFNQTPTGKIKKDPKLYGY